MKYEYAVIYAEWFPPSAKRKPKEPVTRRVTNCDRESIESTLNTMGEFGWELVSIVNADNQLVWYFKKNIPWWNFWS